MRILLLGLLWIPMAALSQSRGGDYASDTSKNIAILLPSYGAYIPKGDLGKRFGWYSEIGAEVLFKRKNNWLYSVSGSVMFGEIVKSDTNAFDYLENSDGGIVGTDGYYAEYSFFQRGFRSPVFKVGKLIPLRISKANANSGFYGMAGLGFMQHKVRIVDHSQNFVQIQNGYVKGYDKLTNGMMLTQNIGYMYLGKNRKINFNLSFEFGQAFTRNRRSFNFDTRQTDTSNRLELMYGVKFAWAIPLYKKLAEGYYYR